MWGSGYYSRANPDDWGRRGRYPLPLEMGATLEGARREIPKDFLSRRERGVQVLRTSLKICQQTKVAFFFFFARLWAFLTLQQEWLVSQAATEKCGPRDQREGHADQSQRSSSCHLLIESYGSQWAPAMRMCKRREQKAPPSRVKLKAPLQEWTPHSQHLSASTAGLVVPRNQKVLADD